MNNKYDGTNRVIMKRIQCRGCSGNRYDECLQCTEIHLKCKSKMGYELLEDLNILVCAARDLSEHYPEYVDVQILENGEKCQVTFKLVHKENWSKQI